uniref:Reduced folate carrier family protein n=1 Tax=Elaeophora elaphi TaxID=1147741 RepID=A0A0R3RGU3_9BILA
MWHFLTALICFYGFIKEFKIGEPFIYLYQSEVLNLTREQITNEIYPFAAYSYLLSLIPIFLLTDLTLYKPTMLLEVISQTIYRGTLVFCPAVWAQKLGMIIYGAASASEIAFFSYIYSKSEKDQYQKLTSYSRAAVMSGRMTSYLQAQIIILTENGSYRSLQCIGFGVPCFVVVLTAFLPSVQWKQVIVRLSDSTSKETVVEQSDLPQTYGAYVNYQLCLMRHNLARIYRVAAIRKWSIWWALTTCMSLQVAQYAQSLWGEIQRGERNSFNGFAEAIYTATAAISILILGLAKINWDRWGELTLAMISLIDTLILITYSQAQSMWIMYACYIGYRSLYQVMMTIAQWNLARKMIGESYGLVFGLNSFIALLLQTLLTIIVPDQHGLNMPVREQFLVYAGCHAFIGTVFLISLSYSLMLHVKDIRSN